MKQLTLTRLILRNLTGRPARSILTVLGVGIGTSAFVALIALADSFSATMDDLFRSRRTDISVVRANSPDVLMSSLPESHGPRLAQVPGVVQVAPVLAEMLWAEEQPASLVLGMAHGTYLLDHFEILEGRGLQADDQDVVTLGRSLAQRLNKKPGDFYEIESYRFTVVGLYDAGNNLENAGAVVPLRRLQWLLNREDEVTAFNLRVQEPDRAATVSQAIEGTLKSVRAVRTDEVAAGNSGLGLAKAMALGTSLIALAIGWIGTLNSMLMTILERTREIGVLRALGWTRRRIGLLLLGESLALSAAGGLLGIGLGTLALTVVLQHPKIQGLLTAGLTATLASQGLMLALGLGLLGGALPAWRGSRLSPTEALRHE